MPEGSMTPDPVDLVREAFDAGNRRDLDAIVGFHAADAVWDLSDQGLGVFEGAGAVRGWLEDWFGAWADLRLDVREIVDLGKGVVFACVLEAGRPAEGGGHVEQQRGWVVLAERGKLAHIAIMLDAPEARATAERLAQERG
jgi:ketosteroid isomerase-like protein